MENLHFGIDVTLAMSADACRGLQRHRRAISDGILKR